MIPQNPDFERVVGDSFAAQRIMSTLGANLTEKYNPGGDLRAMTVNERLSATGLLESFEKAARSRDEAAMSSILARVQMSPQQISGTVTAILQNPAFYGY